MRLFQDRREHRYLLYSWLTLLAVLIIAVLLVRAVYNIYPKYRLANESRETVQVEAMELEARRNQLESDISKLSSLTGEETELRTKYQVSKHGEEVIVIVGESNRSMSKGGDTANVIKSKGVFDYIKSLFVR